MDKICDVIIIGGGPAGYTAALYTARAGLDTLIVERMSVGGQMALTGEIDNYPGFPDGIDGFTLGMNMQRGAERFGARTEYAEVSEVELRGQIKRVVTTSGVFLSRAVIVATGADPRALGVEGESALVGSGVHYCAHCDGRFYAGKTVAVVGGGNSAAEDALYLSNMAKKVYLIHRRGELRASEVYGRRLLGGEAVEPILYHTVEQILADGALRGVRIRDVRSGEERELALDGLFVSVGRKPATEIFAGSLELDPSGYIIADESTRTSVVGVFAAGDVRTKELRQVVTAAADGAVAAYQAELYLS